jgi:hypothetical protein
MFSYFRYALESPSLDSSPVRTAGRFPWARQRVTVFFSDRYRPYYTRRLAGRLLHKGGVETRWLGFCASFFSPWPRLLDLADVSK